MLSIEGDSQEGKKEEPADTQGREREGCCAARTAEPASARRAARGRPLNYNRTTTALSLTDSKQPLFKLPGAALGGESTWYTVGEPASASTGCVLP